MSGENRTTRLLETAVKRRLECIPEDTDLFRLVDGDGDSLPGLVIENYAGRWLAVAGKEFEPEMRTWPERFGCRSVWRQDPRPGSEPVAIAGDVEEGRFVGRENGVSFEIDFRAGSSQGLFLDQRLNRRECADRTRPGDRILNLFAYTCGFSVVAARQGAVTTSVDVSARYLEWGSQNLERNGIDPKTQFRVKGDSEEWLKVFQKKGRTFHGIILDPPTFGRSGKGDFRIERDLGRLVHLAAGLLEPGGWLLCCSNCARMRDETFRRILREHGQGKWRFDPMPPEYRAAPYLKTGWLDVK